MGSWTGFILTYLLGGLTFLPLILGLIFLHAKYFLPIREPLNNNSHSRPDGTDTDSIVQPGDDTTELKAAQVWYNKVGTVADGDTDEPRSTEQKNSNNNINNSNGNSSTGLNDVAAGYFAVCREYTPMGINAKPIERATPVGSATVAVPSQSVYQAMYRSIFDRNKQTTGNAMDSTSNGASIRPKKAGNVFYIVLRHGHLMLFDDDDQLEVRHVISLAHHHIFIFSGDEKTAEGEMFIKKSALCLSRKQDLSHELPPDAQSSRPFYLFSENCSAKEDFYFALLRNQAQVFNGQKKFKPPQPLQFDVKHMILLVQKLHASEENVHTRWLNALLGRIFLGIYKTKDIENLIREKLTKKISRVKRPSFLSRIAIQGIDVGDAAPFFTNPRLKDLSVEGDFVMEADVKYTGNFRLEVAATVRIDLGNRFKAREVNLVLAVMLKRLEGHVLIKIKPPPSNRLWFSFQAMPKTEMSIEPIVSSRQITYNVILRQIENRIKEVVAETLVMPFWDDTPFFRTEHKDWRGGIFAGDDAVEHDDDHEMIAATLGQVDEVAQMEENASGAGGLPSADMTSNEKEKEKEKTQSMPILDNLQSTGFWGRINSKKSSTTTLGHSGTSASSSTTALENKNHHHAQTNTRAQTPLSTTPPSVLITEAPRPIRATSFSASSPVVKTDTVHVEPFRASSSPPDRDDDAVSTMAQVAARSRQNSFIPSSRPPSITKTTSTSDQSSVSSLEVPLSSHVEASPGLTEPPPPVLPRRNTTSSTGSFDLGSPAPSARGSVKSTITEESVGRGFFGRKDSYSSPSPASASFNGNESKRNTLAAVTNAAATAKRWGLNALQRNSDQGPEPRAPAVDLNKPMGRGFPLPPPGIPLPMPDKTTNRNKQAPIMPPPKPVVHPNDGGNLDQGQKRPVPLPPLPLRRRDRGDERDEEGENVFVVEAPEEDIEEGGAWMEEDPRGGESNIRDQGESNDREEGGPPALPPRGEISAGDEDDDYGNWMHE